MCVISVKEPWLSILIGIVIGFIAWIGVCLIIFVSILPICFSSEFDITKLIPLSLTLMLICQAICLPYVIVVRKYKKTE